MDSTPCVSCGDDDEPIGAVVEVVTTVEGDPNEYEVEQDLSTYVYCCDCVGHNPLDAIDVEVVVGDGN